MRSLLIVLTLFTLTAHADDTASWPKEALCLVCHPGGDGALEPVRAASLFEGKTYYFCNTDCKTKFDAAPADFIPIPIPRPFPQVMVTPLESATAQPLAAESTSVLLLDVWATWCKPCAKLIPKLNELQAKLSGVGIRVAGLSVDEEGAPTVAPYVKKKKVTYPIFLDTDLNNPAWKALGVRSIPTLLAVDKQGTIRYSWSSDAVDFTEVELRLRELAAEPTPGEN